MFTRENAVILAAVLATVAGFVSLAVVDLNVGLLGELTPVAVFALLVGVGFVLPQVYLLRVDSSVPRPARLGVLTLVLVVSASLFSTDLSRPATVAIWLLVAASIVVIFASEVRAGYRRSIADESA